MKTPISLIIDDPAPRVFVYYEHADKRFTADGRPLVSEVPNSFLYDFCDVIETYGLRGKFSVIPMPGGRGDIINGIDGFPYSEIREWLDTVRERVAGRFSICPEILTHAGTVDLATGRILDINEYQWSKDKDASVLTPYISRALELLRDADLRVTGVTSPWYFGIDVEAEYVKAISAAFDNVLGIKDSWYFLRALRGVPNAKPWVALSEGGRNVVSIPATAKDRFWQTMDTTDTSPEYISGIADILLTADGTKGEIIDILDSGSWPILIAHWQSLFSNGLGTGLKALAEVGRRINEHLSDKVEWMSYEEIMRLVLSDPASYPMPELE